MRVVGNLGTALCVGGLVGIQILATRSQPDRQAVRRLEELHQWLGGDRLDGLHSVRVEARAAEPLASVSAPGRPPVVMFREMTELRDLASERLRRDSRVVLPTRPDPVAFSELWSPIAAAQGTGNGWGPGSPVQWAENRLGLLYGPERVIQRALAAGDAVAGRDTVIEGVQLATIAFEGGSARLLLAAGVLRGVELHHTLPEDFTWGPLGDLSTVMLFGSWSLEPGGVRYPRSIAVSRNGVLVKQITIHRVDLNSALPDDSLRIAPEVIGRFRSWSPPAPGELVELAPEVALVEGPFQVLLVRQADGIVVLGAPQSSGYSAAVVARAQEWAPGLPISAVVVTSGAAAHGAGIREYAARRVPILARASLVPRLAAILTASHRTAPDALERLDGRPSVRAIEERTTLGAGRAALVLLPNVGLGAEHDETLVAFVPASQLLFASDLYRPARFEPNLWTEPLSELDALVERERLAPTRVTSIHNPPTTWDSAVAILRGNPSARSIRSPR